MSLIGTIGAGREREALGGGLAGLKYEPAARGSDAVSDLELALMRAPASVGTVLWGLFSVSERRILLIGAGSDNTATSPATRGSERRLGNLSMIYETSRRPGQEAAAAATVSSGMLNGRADPGGKSYGAYQLTSITKGGRQVQAFLAADGARWAAEFKGLDPTRPGAFEARWKALAAREPGAFFDAQHAFIKRTHYDKVVDKVREQTGLRVDGRSSAVQDVVWSMSVQHGRAAMLVKQAIASLGVEIAPSSPGYDRALINALYNVREAYVRGNGNSDLVTARYVPERQAALRMLDVR